MKDIIIKCPSRRDQRRPRQRKSDGYIAPPTGLNGAAREEPMIGERPDDAVTSKTFRPNRPLRSIVSAVLRESR